jgi:3-oxoisoapionate decarboxylase
MKKDKEMTIGLSSYTFTWAIGIPGQPQPSHCLTPLELMETAAEMGAEVVQFADNTPMHKFAAGPGGDGRITALLDMARSLNIKIEIGTRGTDPGHLRSYIDLAGCLDCRLVRTVPAINIPVGKDTTGRTEISRTEARGMEAELASLVPELESTGIILCLENYELCPAATIAHIVRTVDSEHIRVCLDSLNSLGRGEGFSTTARTLAPLTGNLHVKDYRIRRMDHRLGFLVEGCPAGDGILPIKELIGLVPAGISVIIELWTPWQGNIASTVDLEREWARKSIIRLKEIIND